ncbi:MAG: proprotein convertase P-domain-containing protein [Myxococcota bacterium]
MTEQRRLTTTPSLTILLALALGTACGDDTAVDPTTGDESSTGSTTSDPTTLPDPTTPSDPTTTTDPTTDPDTTGGECGNGMVEGDEDCDGDDLAGSDCTTEGFEGGTLACGDDCTFDTSMCEGAPRTCGNGQLDEGEDCDGDELDGQDCESLGKGFDGGDLACGDDCTFDTSMCTMVSCGNDMIEGMEVCDGMELAGQDCAMQGFDGGMLACAKDCTSLDTSGCFSCGNDMAEGPEACDGMDLAGEDCTTQGFMFGTLACDDMCQFDPSGCTNDPVFCSAPGTPIGPDAGVMTVDTVMVPVLGEFVADVNVILDANHTFVGDLEIDIRHVDTNTSRRMADNTCGGVDDINATFDQSAMAPPDCMAPIAIEGDVLPLESLDGFTGLPDPTGTWEITITDTAGGDGGMLNNWCVSFQTSAMDPNNCGDGIATFSETCDGMDVSSQTCVSQGFDGGILGCAPDCASFDTSACTTCGDGMLSPPEACDGMDLGGETCVSQGFDGGMLACDAACAFDTTNCFVCGNGIIEALEDCDNQEITGTTCEDLGFAGGSLSCDPGMCSFDTSECSNTVTAVCATPAAPIDSVLPTTTSTVNVPAGLNVLDVDVFVDITHTFNADLDMFLVHNPTGTTVELTTDQCGGDNDLFAFFNDEAAALPDCIEPVGIEGNVQPEGLLSDFDGEAAAGDWTLEVTDDAAGDVGTLNEWCIYILEG